MALQRQNASSVLTRSRFQNENKDVLLGKAGTGKLRSEATGALGNISNRPTHAQAGVMQKGLRKANQNVLHIAQKNFQISKDQENVVPKGMGKEFSKGKVCEAIKPDPQEAPCSPAAMDISVHALNEAQLARQLLNVNDVDKDDHNNPQLVSIYVNEIYDYMRELERKFPIGRKYLDGQDINGRMRGILIDWLIQVHLRFHLLQETLYLTVAIIDRFLEAERVSKSKLQLVGVTAMLVASKYEEMYAPEIGDFVYITDNAYTKADIRRMENLILRTLDFNLGRPLPLHFLRRQSKCGEVDVRTHTLAKYLMELTLVDYEMIHEHPSQVAAAALCLSMKTLDGSTWTDTLEFYSKYSEVELQPTMKRLAVLVQRAGTGKLTAVKQKYQSSKFQHISAAPELKSQFVKDFAEASA